MILIGIVLIVIIWALSTPNLDSAETPLELSDYLAEESDIDFSPELQTIANEISSKHSTPKGKVKGTLEFVNDGIDYDGNVGILECYSESASSVLKKGSGDCVSMSRLTTSLLRLQGIPARTVGGCVSSLNPCSPIFSLVPVEEIPKSEIMDNKKRGFLHEWVEAYVE
jgi:transglutaminase-like putative cysteine protease